MSSSAFSGKVAQLINERILPSDSADVVSTIPPSPTTLPANPKAEVPVIPPTTFTSDQFEDIYKELTNDPEASRLLDNTFQMEVEWDAAALPWEPLSSCFSTTSSSTS